jgi:hypothetical protein
MIFFLDNQLVNKKVNKIEMLNTEHCVILLISLPNKVVGDVRSNKIGSYEIELETHQDTLGNWWKNYSRQISYFASSTGAKSNTYNCTNSPSLDLQVNTNWVSSAWKLWGTKVTYETIVEFMLSSSKNSKIQPECLPSVQKEELYQSMIRCGMSQDHIVLI